MALVNLETYYSFPNISDENNVFRYSPGFVEVGRGDSNDSTRQRQWVEIQIPEGSYDLIDIAETIKIAMKRYGHNDDSIQLTANTNTLKSALEISATFKLISEQKVQAYWVSAAKCMKTGFTNLKMLSIF